MYTLIISATEEYTFNTLEEVADKANELARVNNRTMDFDLEGENFYFGFLSWGYTTVENLQEWIEQEKHS